MAKEDRQRVQDQALNRVLTIKVLDFDLMSEHIANQTRDAPGAS